MRLAEEGEELTDLMKLAPDVILIRWVNYHLMKIYIQHYSKK